MIPTVPTTTPRANQIIIRPICRYCSKSSSWQSVSSEWHGVQPVQPRVQANRDFSKCGEAPSAGINGRSALRPNGKPHLGRVIKVNLHGKFSLRKVRVRRIELRDYVARQILSFSVCPPDAVHFRPKHLARVEIERDFNRLSDFHILECFLSKAGQHVAVAIDNK